ncbi:NAD(P)-dependent alcohol dehydrogenase [Micromonospora sp. A3M-1-15]|uniref:zinc-dependent alcohol dehydrogenase family protein n=1 Tax=Micromonospora sp. A3M-1-15 TaxID=2962035 RepID=UPI0020B783A6|nr:NAD(P)-dependent alcohol dehydrogenase [Micromonospora sp. A3M-1-15]MCP3785430.1 NAD(P)-dependent alcohol dehydrogenase [Micromonospora sp. A3M-1-15]
MTATLPPSVRSYHVNSGDGIDGLSLRTHEPRTPGIGEVAVAVQAVSLSFRDLLVLRGRYVLPVKPDVIPVSDGAGQVIAVGPGVQRVRPGDRVTAALFPQWRDGPLEPSSLPQLGGSLDGMLTELAVLPEQALLPIPEHLSYAEAATLPCAAVTAWNALTGDGPGIQPGHTVLTTGSGGVSLFAVQLAKLLGAKVIATTGQAEKEQRLRDLGADEVVNYRTVPDWHTAVRDITGGRGVDRVVDTAGTLEQSLKSLAINGHVAFVGSLSGDWPPLDPRLLFGVAATVRALAVGSHAQFTKLNEIITAHQLRPVTDRAFPFEEAGAAFRHYESASPFGKVIIEIR